jgi:hypothetical protein
MREMGTPSQDRGNGLQSGVHPHINFSFQTILKINKMKNLMINGGKFTGKQNFSGYSTLGERVHIFGLQMAAMGVTTDAEVKFPFYVIAEVKPIAEITTELVDGVVTIIPTGITHPRLTALSVFKTREELKSALADVALLEAEITAEIVKGASVLGLSKASIDALILASV